VSVTTAPERPAAPQAIPVEAVVTERVLALVERELDVIGAFGTALLDGSDRSHFDTAQGAERIIALLNRLEFTAGAILARELAAVLTAESPGPAEGLRVAALIEDVRAAIRIAATEATVLDPTAPTLLLVGQGSATLDTIAWVALRHGLRCSEALFTDAPGAFAGDHDAVVLVGLGREQLALVRSLRERHVDAVFVAVGGDRLLLSSHVDTVMRLDTEPSAVLAEVRRLVAIRSMPLRVGLVGDRRAELVKALTGRGMVASLAGVASVAAVALATTYDCLLVDDAVEERLSIARQVRADPATRDRVLVQLGTAGSEAALRAGYDAVVPADADAEFVALQLGALARHHHDLGLEPRRQHLLSGQAAAIVLERMLVSAHREDRSVSVGVVALTESARADIESTAEALAVDFRSGDLVARWDDDHLLVALRGVPRRTAVARLRGTLDRFGLLAHGCRAAVVEFPFDASSPAGLLKVALASIATSQSHDGPDVVGSEWSPDASKGADVVIIDRDAALARVLAAHLEARGLTSVTFDTGVAGLAWLQDPDRAAPGLVLMDLNLGGIDGLQVLRQLRATGALSRFRLLVVTATSREDDLREAFRLGAWDVVAKPFSFVVLDNRISRGLGI
jgi:CheY-like chemotaxis protein